MITSTKLYVPVITLSINDNIKFLENIKQWFKRTIFWNKYRSEITAQPKINNLDNLIDPAFRNFNRLFVLSFKNGVNDPTRGSFETYYLPLVKIKDWLIWQQIIFDQPVKINKKLMKNLLKYQEMITIQHEIY